MTNLLDYAQFGVAIFTIGVLAFLVVKFLEFMKAQETNFKNTIDNHLNGNTKANSELAAAIKELLDFLKWQNKK